MSRGDPDTVRAMYDEHSADLFAYFARRVGRDLAEDLLAETFRAAIESVHTFDRSRGTARAWLFGIGTNLLRRHWTVEKKRLLTLQRAESVPEVGADPLWNVADGVARRVDAEGDAARLLAAVSELDPFDRDLLTLSGWERLNSREIGQVLELSPEAVRTRLHRIRRDLRRAMTTPEPTSRPTGAPR